MRNEIRLWVEELDLYDTRELNKILHMLLKYLQNISSNKLKDMD
jgi:hypothetical protein